MHYALLLFAPMLLAGFAWAGPAVRTAAVENGVLRWRDDGSEVALFGVNYYPPFSIDYKAIKDRGLDHEKAIRDDVAHFERLGLNTIRLHCWDREISDHEGNLRDNEHLRLLDYLISECAKRGIYSVMTPIAWWSSPEKGGFADLYTMHQMTTDAKSRATQPATSAMELVLIESGGSPWGIVVPLTQRWQAIRIPLSDLKYFSHWKDSREAHETRPRPERIEFVSICFGAWLYGADHARPHAVEIQDVSLQ